MIVAIHQPNYLPWPGFFDKMSSCDRFVFLDTVPFSKHGYQNRCQIKTAGGGLWLTVPVLTRGRVGQRTDLVEIDTAQRWAARHWRTLAQSYAGTPYFPDIEAAIGSMFTRSWARLVDLNIALISEIASALKITTATVRASELPVSGTRSELLRDICRAVGATRYLSGPSGAQYLDETVFERQGINVVYHKFVQRPHPQRHGDFVPGLSVVDAWANLGSFR